MSKECTFCADREREGLSLPCRACRDLAARPARRPAATGYTVTTVDDGLVDPAGKALPYAVLDPAGTIAGRFEDAAEAGQYATRPAGY